MPKSWKFRPVDAQATDHIIDLTHLPEPLARILALRGFDEANAIDRFLKPRLSDLSDPFLLPDMKKAVDRIWKAILGKEPITVFGDYDVDGVTSCALLTRALTEFGANVNSFIPDRLDEGYGLSQEALERCVEQQSSTLIITVDCGVNSVESIASAQSQGVDVIVTDHHEPDQQTAPAFALINPKLGTKPALEILSGVGVAFKLAHALIKTGREQGNAAAGKVDLRNYLDIAALGTVTDMVPLIDENRILVRHGLAMLNTTKWEGMRALKNVAGMRGDADTYHLGFQLGPRINAVGRIGQPLQALRLLTTDDPAEARELADLLDSTNVERRKLEQDMADQAFAEIDSYFDPQKDFGLVVAHRDWHPGVVGIVASRISRHYNRPSIVLGIDDEGAARGSCRSIDAFDVLEGLRACDQHLNKYGGHKMAAGAEVAPSALDAFKADFNTAAASVLKSIDLSPVQYIDASIKLNELDWDFYKQLKSLQPFGQNNPEPIWMLHRIGVIGKPRIVGKKHLKLTVGSRDRKFEAIAFNYSLKQLPDGLIDIAFTLKENFWNGNTSLQLQIKDIRVAEAT
jgi:single-stranded-DNA-specific exonuclease